MLGAVAGDAAGKDFATLGGIATQFHDIFVIDAGHFIHAEAANFLFRFSASFPSHC